VTEIAIASQLYLPEPWQLHHLVAAYHAVSPLSEAELALIAPIRRSWMLRHVLFCAAALGRVRSASQAGQFARELGEALDTLETERARSTDLTDACFTGARA
jgi:Ser/Thr protein kinase RdoA (MazF antagonist)